MTIRPNSSAGVVARCFGHLVTVTLLLLRTASGMTTASSGAATTVQGLYRHAVKGLSADAFDSVTVQAMETFPDDRRFALLKANKESFHEQDPKWLHKANFLCAFSAPELMAKYRAEYSIQAETSSPSISLGLPNDTLLGESDDSSKRLLNLYERKSDKILLDSLDLSTSNGRDELADFFSQLSGESLTCVTADNFQFGNTSSGVKKKNGNTRTVHIVNAATVRDLSKAMALASPEASESLLNPTRFRPNIVIDGLEPWEEFEWVGKSISCGTTKMDVISRTVRCEGVGIDPLVYPEQVLDIPALLIEHFPQHGPYLGVYASIEQGGTIQLGDSVSLVS